MPSYIRIWHRPLKITCILFDGWPHKLFPYSLEEDETPKTKKNIGKNKKHKKQQKSKKHALNKQNPNSLEEGGLDKSP